MTQALKPQKGVLVPRAHEEPVGIPYFDEELGVPQNTAHRIMVSETAPIFAAIAGEAGLRFRGVHRPRLAGERERAEQARQQAEQERERAERLAARLRELGLDPDA